MMKRKTWIKVMRRRIEDQGGENENEKKNAKRE